MGLPSGPDRTIPHAAHRRAAPHRWEAAREEPYGSTEIHRLVHRGAGRLSGCRHARRTEPGRRAPALHAGRGHHDRHRGQGRCSRGARAGRPHRAGTHRARPGPRPHRRHGPEARRPGTADRVQGRAEARLRRPACHRAEPPGTLDEGQGPLRREGRRDRPCRRLLRRRLHQPHRQRPGAADQVVDDRLRQHPVHGQGQRRLPRLP